MSATNGTILGMCNPLLDISAEVPTDVFDKYGIQKGNAILAEEKHLPLYDEMVKDYPVQYIAGGAGLNSIRVAQWMLQQPDATAYFGAIGVDEFGDLLEKGALEDGVKVSMMKNPERPTGTCAVLIDGDAKERSLVANIAAADTFKESHLDEAVNKEIIKSSKIVYVTGFFLTVSVESILKLANHCVEDKVYFTMNLSAPFLIEFFGDQMASVMPYTDFIFGNESEAATYGKTKGWGEDLKEIALKLAAEPKRSATFPRIVVFTQGSEGTIVASHGKVTEYPVEMLPKEQLVDTNGAGDAFVGGFLSQLYLGKSMAECVEAGHFAARIIIQRSGCTFPKNCDFAAAKK